MVVEWQWSVSRHEDGCCYSSWNLSLYANTAVVLPAAAAVAFAAWTPHLLVLPHQDGTLKPTLADETMPSSNPETQLRLRQPVDS